MKHALLLAIALGLSACGPQAAGDKSASQKAAGPAPAVWNAADACGLVSAADVGAAAGATVSETKLEYSNPGQNGLATVSMCRYSLSNGASITLLARRSPSPDASAEAIEAARTMGGNAPAAEAVEGLGKAAWWTPQMKSLQVFIDDQRYVTLAAFQGVADPKTVLVGVAKKSF